MSEKREEYVPFGEEWTAEMMRKNKTELTDMLRDAYIESQKLTRHIMKWTKKWQEGGAS